MIASYSGTKIVMKLGRRYAYYPRLDKGDKYLIQVAGVTVGGIVAFS